MLATWLELNLTYDPRNSCILLPLLSLLLLLLVLLLLLLCRRLHRVVCVWLACFMIILSKVPSPCIKDSITCTGAVMLISR
ncbi:hypothetical protein I7I53_11192 [Histoplasma capsulatum var. duboisii H88]|uniref:Uncharacterized protein n=1 Tax=Ajellomyces capsulatus (strain H88) TaxID=544711 RepID=A0A8A1LER2_AJEC8|nr:hypothetical protein I7I53_11192 [Histoplasma capsulatum var. duboisii H88]